MYKMLYLCILTLLLQSATTAPTPNRSPYRIVPQTRTPESDTVETFIVFPKDYENRRKQPINFQLRLQGYPLGTMSQFERKNLLYNNPKGQTVHVIIDNRPYLAFNNTIEDSYDENRLFYDRILNFELPYTLAKGQHVIRVFPARSYGESLKDPGAFAASIFYLYDPKRENNLDVDLSKPYLTYNEPQGTYPAESSNPVLLDFYLTNCNLSSDGFKVRLTIDGEIQCVITQWVPYYIWGFKKGEHTIRLQLLNKDNEVISGLFNDTSRTITIE